MADFTPNHDVGFVRDDGTHVEVAMVVRCEGYPLPYYVEDHVAKLDNGNVVDLTEAEVERLDIELADNPPES